MLYLFIFFFNFSAVGLIFAGGSCSLILFPIATVSPAGHTPPSPSSPAYQRVFRSRYKMVARVGVANTQHYSPSLSWRTKRIQTAR